MLNPIVHVTTLITFGTLWSAFKVSGLAFKSTSPRPLDGTFFQALLKGVVTCFHPPNRHFPLSGSCKTFHFSYMKFLCLLKFLFIKVSSIFKEKKIQDGMSRIQFWSIGFAVPHFNPFTTEDLLSMNGLIWIYIATTLTLTLTLCTNH